MGWERHGYTSEGYTSCGTYLFFIFLALTAIGVVALIAKAVQ